MTNVSNGNQPQDEAQNPEQLLSYKRVFMPTGPDGKEALNLGEHGLQQLPGDQTAGLEYEYSEDVILAVNIAITTERPLLVSGRPGTGKSSLARSIARWQGWPFYEHVITSRTQARDLLWHFDSLQRLGDAQVVAYDETALQRLNERFEYVKPGVLWWAFDPSTAERRGAPEEKHVTLANNPAVKLGPRPTCDWIRVDERIGLPKRAVILLDEIDKADPDVPNDLLVPLGALRFEVAETGTKVTLASDHLAPPLIIITNNGERALPPAFLRRCVTLTLPDPDVPWLARIATRRFGEEEKKNKGLYKAVAKQMLPGSQSNNRNAPGTAEFLDAIRACKDLEARHDEPGPWKDILSATLIKGRVGEEQA